MTLFDSCSRYFQFVVSVFNLNPKLKDCYLQAGEYYSINYEIEAAMKAERIDLHSSSDNNQGENTPFSEYGTNPEDQFRSGPLDYTL